MLDIDLPLDTVFHQKIALEDVKGAIPRDLPFFVDLDSKVLDWTAEEHEWLASEPALSWLTKTITGGTHCRPEGGTGGTWVKMGWAYNNKCSEPQQNLTDDPHYDEQFPEIVMRGGGVAVCPSHCEESPAGLCSTIESGAI